MNTIKTILILLPVIFSSGCIISRPVQPETGYYYIDPSADFSNIGKVVVFELTNRSTQTELGQVLTKTITESLQKRHLFNVRSLYKSDDDWQSLDLKNDLSYTLDELVVIRKQLKTDAILFGSVTWYEPYPHMLVGLHLKLLDLRSGNLLWAMEQVWDSTDKRTEQRMKAFFDRHMRTGYQPMDWHLLITSPRAFNKFVAYEITRTFPRTGGYINSTLSSEKSENFRTKSLLLKKTLQFPQKTLEFAEKIATIGM